MTRRRVRKEKAGDSGEKRKEERGRKKGAAGTPGGETEGEQGGEGWNSRQSVLVPHHFGNGYAKIGSEIT